MLNQKLVLIKHNQGETEMDRLLHSSKFWLLVIDTVISLLLFFVGKYAGVALEDVKTIITYIQPIFVFVILAIMGEDIASKLNGIKPGPPVQ